MQRWALYLSILALSLLAHVWGIGSPVLDYHAHRQANTASIARNFHRYDRPPHRPRVDWLGGGPERAATELPLYMWLVGLLWPVFGLAELWGRLLSVAASAATALLLFAALERKPGGVGWFETRPAWLAALAFAVLPIEVYFGRTVQPEAFALMSSVAAVWALDRHLAAQGARAWLWWGLAVLAAGSAIGHKLPYAYLLGVLACLALARRGRAALLDPKLWAVPVLVAGIVFGWYRYAAAGIYVVPTTKDTAQFWQLLDYARAPYYACFQVFSRLPELALTYPGAVLLALGIREAVFVRRLWFLAGWWACVLLGLLAGGGYVHDHDYTALPWAPINAAFIGIGAWRLWESSSGGRRAFALALGLGMPLHAALRINHWYRLSRPEIMAAAPAAAAVSRPDDLFLCNERASSLLLFYIDRKGWSWDLAELGEPGLERVQEVVRAGARFFMTYKDGIFLDRSHPVAGWFFARYPVAYEDDRFLIFRLDPAP